MRCGRPEGVVRLSMGIMKARHHCSSSWWRHYKRIRDSEYYGGSGEPPACGVFGEATRARRSPTADVARPPHVCAFARLRGSLREVRIWCYHHVRWSVVLQRYFGDGSRTAVAFWCGAVFFSRISVDARSQGEFGGGFLRVSVGGHRAPYCCRSVWLCSFFFFLYVVFHDYLLVFTPSLSMKL